MQTCEAILPEGVFQPQRLIALVERAKTVGPIPTAVCWPVDELSLAGVLDAEEEGLIAPHLVGPAQELQRLAARLDRHLHKCKIVNVMEPHEAARRSVEMCRNGQTNVLMKGHLHTDELLHAVLEPNGSHRTSWMSHIFVAEVPHYDRLIFISDAGVNINPTLAEKRLITQNAITVAKILGVAQPKVAILSAVETVETRMLSSVDAAALSKMAERGQIVGAMVDGPLAFDVAVCGAAAEAKGLVSGVAGKADILIAPNLEAGNILAKALEHLTGAALAGIVFGAGMPIILTSRADSSQSRVFSSALAVLMSEQYRLAHHSHVYLF